MKAIVLLLVCVIILVTKDESTHEEQIKRRVILKPFIGISAFSILSCNFPCSKFIPLVNESKKPGTAVLLGTFGSNYKCINKFTRVNRNKPHLVEFHLSNEACRRNRRCRKGELFRSYSVRRYNYKLETKSSITRRKIIGRVTNLLQNFELYPQTRLLLSTGLEDNFSLLAYNHLLEMIIEVWPYETVRSGVKSHYFGSADYLELHGLRPNLKFPCVYSNDGSEILSMQGAYELYNRYSHCRAFLYWDCRIQGVCGRNFVDPLRRAFKIDSPLEENFVHIVKRVWSK